MTRSELEQAMKRHPLYKAGRSVALAEVHTVLLDYMRSGPTLDAAECLTALSKVLERKVKET